MLLWITTLVHSLVGTRLPFIIMLTLMFLTFQLLKILISYMQLNNLQMYKDGNFTLPYEIGDDLLNLIGFLSLDLAYWLFSVKYWATSVNMEKMRFGGEISSNSRVKITFWSGVALNIFFPICYLTCYSYENFCQRTTFVVVVAVISSFGIIGMRAVSLGFLISAMARIKRVI